MRVDGRRLGKRIVTLALGALVLASAARARAQAPPPFERHIGRSERVLMRVGAFLALGLGAAGIWFAHHAQSEVDRVNGELDPYRRFACPVGQPGNRCDVHGNPAPPLSQDDIRRAQDLLDEADRWKTWSDRAPQLYAASAQALVGAGLLFVGGFLLSDTRAPGAQTAPGALLLPLVEERGRLAGLSLRLAF